MLLEQVPHVKLLSPFSRKVNKDSHRYFNRAYPTINRKITAAIVVIDTSIILFFSYISRQEANDKHEKAYPHLPVCDKLNELVDFVFNKLYHNSFKYVYIIVI